MNTAKTITIEAAGKDKKIETTALTVGQALTEAGIAVDSDDKVSTKESTKLKDGLEFSVTKVDVKTVTKTTKVGYDTVYKNTDDLDKGKTEGRDRGQERQAHGRLHRGPPRRQDGEADEEVLQDHPQGHRQGGAGGHQGGRGGSSGGSTSGNSVWDRLAQCESGGNWSINTGNGFYGGVQFSASTWRAMGGSGLPHQHSRETQIAVAKKLQARAGWGQWPGCSSKLGLR